MKKLSFQIALGGIISALCVVMMFSVGLFPVLVYVFPMLSSLLIFILQYECGTKTALTSYVSVALLSVILSPDKESALIFTAYFGYYPIMNTYIERLKSSVLRWVIRLAVFNTAMIVSYLILTKLFVAVTLDDFGRWTAPILLASGNVLAILYDYALRNISQLYVKKLRKSFFKRK